MLSSLLDWLFCPVHGVVPPLIPYVGVWLYQARTLLMRLVRFTVVATFGSFIACLQFGQLTFGLFNLIASAFFAALTE